MGASEQLVGDLAVPGDAAERLCAGADTIVHLAGPNEVRTAREPQLSLTELITSTMSLASAARAAGVRRTVYVSTVHVYGDRLRPGERVDEETPCEPCTAYAIARLAAEHVLRASGPPEAVVLRLTNSVGAPATPAVDRWSLVANDLCRQAALTGRLVLRSDGRQWRDFVALSDVCRIVGDLCQPGVLPHGTYNLGSGVPMTILEMATVVQEVVERTTGRRPDLVVPDGATGPDPGPPPCVAVDRLELAGWTAKSPVGDAIAETLRFCYEHRLELSGSSRPEERR